MAATDEAWMRRALDLAQAGWGQVAPNPLVGAVVVNDHVAIGEGAHRRFGGPHAEVEALAAAGAASHGSTLYVTLEPCTHVGKTPPCVDAIIDAGVARVAVAVRDPNPDARGGVEKLRSAGIAVDLGLLGAEAVELNAPFFHAFQSDRPWVTLKLAVSMDGAIAGASREQAWLTGVEARRRVHHLRAGSDAIAVGMGTVLADDPQLTVRNVDLPRMAPLRVVFSRTGKLPLTSRLARHARQAPVLVVATQPDPDHARTLRGLSVDVLQAATLGEALRSLTSRGVRSLLVEGGASLATSLLEEDLVDRVVLFRAPVLLGAGSLPAFGSLTDVPSLIRRSALLAEERIGDDQMLVLAPEGH
jgi:diaminohydroxyphosphoribosylaminopyrimidine deaminase/5-amino-6-(5-phosphoribosylamino)uracil reductase